MFKHQPISLSAATTDDVDLLDLAHLAVAGVRGCDAASVTVAGEGGWTTVAATDGIALDLDSVQYKLDDGPCLTAVRAGTLIRVEDFEAEQCWSAMAEDARAVGVRSSLSVPLRDGEQVLGGLNLYAGVRAAFSADDEQAAEVIGRQGGLALRYLRLLNSERSKRAAEHDIAETLQRSLLPALPDLPGIECAARYLPGGRDAQVGGDWYDVFPLPDGAVGLAVGDVMGHDVAAAAAMGQLRSVLRSYAYEGSTPAVVLDRMDRLVQSFDMAQLATAFYGRLVLDRDGALLIYANAGHLPPLWRRPDGTCGTAAGAASRPIGAPDDHGQSRSEAAVSLPMGSTLVLFTDGLVESRARELEVGLHRLTDLVQGQPATGDLEDLVDTVVKALVDPEPGDDVAVLAVRMTGQGRDQAGRESEDS